jgi:hypothetical protein
VHVKLVKLYVTSADNPSHECPITGVNTLQLSEQTYNLSIKVHASGELVLQRPVTLHGLRGEPLTTVTCLQQRDMVGL